MTRALGRDANEGTTAQGRVHGDDFASGWTTDSCGNGVSAMGWEFVAFRGIRLRVVENDVLSAYN